MEKYYLNKDEAVLLVIDIQERMLPVIDKADKVGQKNEVLIEAAKLLGVPIVVTEHNADGLGHTVDQLSSKMTEAKVFHKTTFSACNKEFLAYLNETKRNKIIVTGTETHVCVFQTVRSLLDNGFSVFLVADAVGSRTEMNLANAVSQMKDMGAVITNTETAVFDLLKESGTPEFKALLKLIK
jgi:nicotinamidase-related amidase